MMEDTLNLHCGSDRVLDEKPFMWNRKLIIMSCNHNCDFGFALVWEISHCKGNDNSLDFLSINSNKLNSENII